MKLGDILGVDKRLSTVKVISATIYSTLSQSDESKILELLSQNARFFVFLGGLGNEILVVKERSTVLAKIVSHRVVRSVNSRVLFFNNGRMSEVTKENVAKIYDMLSQRVPVPVCPNGMEKVYVERKETDIFREGMPERRNKKPARHGYIRTFVANSNMNLM